MSFTLTRIGKRGAAVVATLVLVARAGIGVARASDHQDNPLVELNPAMDMTDVYAFPGSSPDRIALVLNSWGFITPAQASTTYLDSARRRERLKNLSGRECLFRRRRRCANARLPL